MVFITKDILIDLGLSHVKLFNDHFHLKQNYGKAIGPYFSEVSLLINRMKNASSKEIFDKYTKDLLKYSEGKLSLIQLVNEMIKTKDFYVIYFIDHTPGSCCQRGSTRLEQKHSSFLSHLGKEFTCELEEVLIYLLNRQINLVKGYNKQILIQASQMRITKENIKKAKQHPMLLDASNDLNQDTYNAFHTSYMDRMNYKVTIQLDGLISILRADLEQKPHLFRNKTDRCTCKEATGYSRQSVHKMLFVKPFQSILL